MRYRRFGAAMVLCVLAAAGVWTAAPAAAANSPIVVTTTADVMNGGDGVLSLREAFEQANKQAGDDLIELGTEQTYGLDLCDLVPENRDLNFDGDLDHTDATGALTVEGHDSTIDASEACHSRAIDQRGTGLLTLNHLEVSGGNVGEFFDGADSASGGGVAAAGDVHGNNLQMFDNATDGGGPSGPPGQQRGGAVFASGDVVLTDSFLAQNHGFRGGAVFGDAVSLVRTTITDNDATGSGGGVGAATSVEATDSNVSGNRTGESGCCNQTTYGSGGGLAAPHVELEDTRVIGNETAGSGGGIQADTVVAVDSAVSGNSASGFSSSTAGQAYAGDGGAGINASTSVTLVDSIVGSNLLFQSVSAPRRLVGHANGAGTRSGGDVVVRRSNVGNNHALQGAHTAGIWAAGDVTVSNSTVSHNGSQFGRGGGIAAGGDVRLTHATVIRNGAPVGANVAAGERLRTNRSIIGRPRVGLNCAVGVGTLSGGYNVIGTGGTCGVGGGVGDRTGVDPLNLGPRTDDGAHVPTDSTFSIIPPAACHAAVDQLGTTRPQGSRCEAGAVEVP